MLGSMLTTLRYFRYITNVVFTEGAKNSTLFPPPFLVWTHFYALMHSKVHKCKNGVSSVSSASTSDSGTLTLKLLCSWMQLNNEDIRKTSDNYRCTPSDLQHSVPAVAGRAAGICDTLKKGVKIFFICKPYTGSGARLPVGDWQRTE